MLSTDPPARKFKNDLCNEGYKGILMHIFFILLADVKLTLPSQPILVKNKRKRNFIEDIMYAHEFNININTYRTYKGLD